MSVFSFDVEFHSGLYFLQLDCKIRFYNSHDDSNVLNVLRQVVRLFETQY